MQYDIYDRLPQIFTMEAFLDFSMKKGIANKLKSYRLLEEYIKEKKIYKVRNGLYCKKSHDDFLVGNNVFHLGYIALSQALYLMRLKSEPSSYIYVGIDENKKIVKFPYNKTTITYIPCNLPLAGITTVGSIFDDDERISIFNYPKTVFDICFYPKRKLYMFADLDEALRRKNLTGDEYRELLYYVKTFGNLTTVRIIGSIFESYGKSPAWFIEELEKMNKRKGYSYMLKNFKIRKNEYKNNFDKKWRLYIV
jgi:predicted transcriptional regulator of viral defense system